VIRFRAWVVGAAVALAALGSCYHGGARDVSLAEIAREPGWVIVPGMRVIRQESAHDCGAAALAMVLERWGIPDAAPAIRRAVPLQSDHGLPAGKLRQFARDQGLHAFIISGVQADLVNEVQANRPVLVGLIQRYVGSKDYSHYEVIIGFNRARGRVLLLDPGHGAREDELASFDQEWKDAGRLALVVAPS
jgi:ABC-type bacteriocin/lantibiotic exporter with double-glycine peptidase domain